MKKSPGWLNFVIAILDFIEKVLPAVLVARNSALKSKIARLRSQVSLAKHEMRQQQIKTQVEARYADKSDRDVIDDFINPSSPGDE